MEKDQHADRKKNKDRANKSASNLNDQGALKEIVTVADDIALTTAVMSNTPFVLAEIYDTMSIPHSSHIPIAPIMEALHKNTTVKNLLINNRIWDQKELKEFVRCLASVNRGITKIVLQSHDFEPNFIEALVKILKLNRQIKTIEITSNSTQQFHEKGFIRLCGGMEYYNFEEIFAWYARLSADLYKLWFESLRYNQSIKRIRILGEEVSGAPMIALCNTLVANPTITDLRFVGCKLNQEDFKHFKQVLKVNYIKQLMFRETTFTKDILKLIAEELTANTSITELRLEWCESDWKLLGEILSANKTIKKLDISENLINDRNLKYLNLGSNTTLTDLNLINCRHLTDHKALFVQLMDNKTLKKLAIGHSTANPDPKMLEQFISTNNSVTELTLHTDYNPYKDEVLQALADGLAVNRSIRKFTMLLMRIRYSTFINLIEALKRSNTLLELHTTKLGRITLDRRPANGSDIDDVILDLLKTNQSLRYITGAEDYPYLEARLKENRDTQDKIIRDTCTWLNMIVTKPHSFILPIELWLHIFKFVSYSFVHFDFERYFNSRVQ